MTSLVDNVSNFKKTKLSESEFLDLKVRLSKANEMAFVVASSSMSPLIRVGDPIVVVPPVNLKPFDIVVFFKDGTLVCHYVVEIKNAEAGEQIVTRGLYNHHKDEPIVRALVLGVVVNYTLPDFNSQKSHESKAYE